MVGNMNVYASCARVSKATFTDTKTGREEKCTVENELFLVQRLMVVACPVMFLINWQSTLMRVTEYLK